jgi:hypothetical protein
MFIVIFPCSVLNVFFPLSVNFHLATLIIFGKQQKLWNLILPTLSCRRVAPCILGASVLITIFFVTANDQGKKARKIKTSYFKTKYLTLCFFPLGD